MRGALQKIALDWPMYGYRRLTMELHRQGFLVNHKRVLKMMREDNLLCFGGGSFIATTDSEHTLPVYPNLARQITPARSNELWVADITYVRLEREFVYLAVVLDVWSRRIIGWALSRRLDGELTLKALRGALAWREVRPGLVHHSDRGVQYASTAYTQLLCEHRIVISMSRKGNPYDNAFAESFMKTLKKEEVYANEYETLEEANRSIGHFIDEVYNQKRLHSAIGYVPPAEYEANPIPTPVS